MPPPPPHPTHAHTNKSGVQCDVVLIARNKDGLEETKSMIVSSSPGISVHILPLDLGDLDTLQSVCGDLLNPGDQTKHQQFILIHNAGTLDTFQSSLIELSDGKATQKFFDINYTSMTVLTAKFLSTFPTKQSVVIHMSSLLATVHVAGFPLYSPSRAARNAYMGVLTAENPEVRVLTYSPGPCDTDMFYSIPQHIREGFMKVISPQESISKLASLLGENTFKNGCVIDYYDD